MVKLFLDSFWPMVLAGIKYSIPMMLISFALGLVVALSQSRRLPLLQVVSKNKSFSVGVQSPTEINAPRGCAVILKRICQFSLTRITHQVSRAFDLNCCSWAQ